MRHVTFQEALEVLESFPEEQRESILNIAARRMIDDRRDQIARNIQKAGKEFMQGRTRRGTVEDIMKEIAG